ncbi:MAG: hypothetical protein EKK53_17760 [Burkholderiales bacterium]|nr:MAG: hypothetical protein EKK53_17760 [Burkholderiales bacterium]
MNPRPLALAAGLLACMAAQAVSVTAQITAESALVGLQVAARQRAAKGLLPAEQNACFQALKSSEYFETAEAIVNKALSPAELAAADAFFESLPGRKYARHGVLAIYPALGEPLPAPLPELSAADGQAIEAFSATPVGQALLKRQVLQTWPAREALDRRGQELVARCKAVKPERAD